MWQNRDGLSNDLVLNKDNMNFNDNSDLNNPKTSISPYYQQTQEPIPFNDGLIKASNTVNEIGTQAQSDYCFPDYHKRKYEYSNEQITDNNNRSKRGRGRGSRGSYRPRGRARFLNNTVSNSYGVTTQLPRVCVNPEILKILGYSNQNSTEYYYGHTNRLSNNYGLQVVIDSQTGLPQTMMNRTNELHQHDLGSHISNYTISDTDNNELKQNEIRNMNNNFENSSDQFYRNEMGKQYYYSQYDNCNSNDAQEFILEDKLHQNINDFSSQNFINNQNGNYINASNNIIGEDQKSILDISRSNQHQHLVEWETFKQGHTITDNNPSIKYENYTTEAAEFMNEIEVIFRNENNIYSNSLANTNNIQNSYICTNSNEFLSNEELNTNNNNTNNNNNINNYQFNDEPFEQNELDNYKANVNIVDNSQTNYDSHIIEEQKMPTFATKNNNAKDHEDSKKSISNTSINNDKNEINEEDKK